MRFFILMMGGFFLVAGCCKKDVATNADRSVLEKDIQRYFSSWSQADMQAYRQCFHPSAHIVFVDENKMTTPFLLDEFIASQTLAHQTIQESMKEEPVRIHLYVDRNVAYAVVRWRLFKGEQSSTGTDYFTFLKTSDGWKIIGLLFENDIL
jgi:hypothetical protein